VSHGEGVVVVRVRAVEQSELGHLRHVTRPRMDLRRDALVVLTPPTIRKKTNN
jgi:hypothetical protein